MYALNNKGAALGNLGRSEEAITWFDKALKRDPIFVDALNNKGAALGDLGNYEEAITWYDKAFAIDPGKVNALNNKGVALKNLGKYEEAITWYDKALKIDPGFVYTLYNKGLALYDLGKYEESITWYDKALAIDPLDIDILNNKAVAISKLTPDLPSGTNPKKNGNTSNNNGLLYTSRQLLPLPTTIITFVSSQGTSSFDVISTGKSSSNSTSATNIITSAPTVNSKIVDMFQEQTSSGLAAASIHRIQTGDTITPYDEAIKIDPDNIQLLTNAGIYLADKKEMYLQAISLFDKVLKKDTNYVQAIYNKAETLEKLGRSGEAQILFDTAKELDPAYEGDFILSPPKVSKASISAVSILASAD